MGEFGIIEQKWDKIALRKEQKSEKVNKIGGINK